MEDILQLWNSTQKVDVKGDIGHPVKRLTHIENQLYLLTTNNNLYYGALQSTDNGEQLRLQLWEGSKFTDIDCDNKFLYAIDEVGRVWKYTDKIEAVCEIKLIEDSKMCVHGHAGVKKKMRVEKISVGQFGILFITDCGQLWATGTYLSYLGHARH